MAQAEVKRDDVLVSCPCWIAHSFFSRFLDSVICFSIQMSTTTRSIPPKRLPQSLKLKANLDKATALFRKLSPASQQKMLEEMKARMHNVKHEKVQQPGGGWNCEEMTVAATRGLVVYLNKNIKGYGDHVACAKVLYSMAGWADRYATDEHDCCAEDFAPKLMSVLEEVKEAHALSGLDLTKLGCPWFANAVQRSVMIYYGINLDFLEMFPDEGE